jgi:hypothetical protein
MIAAAASIRAVTMITAFQLLLTAASTLASGTRSEAVPFAV